MFKVIETTNLFGTADTSNVCKMKSSRNILMCKDVEVYDIENDRILDTFRCPTMIANGYHIGDWLSHRRSSKTNRSANDLKNKIYEGSSNEWIDNSTRAVSLNDCYWIKKADSKELFKNISPYYDNYWGLGKTLDTNTAKPDLYTSGSKSKTWRNKFQLFKECSTDVFECYKLCTMLGVPVCPMEQVPNGVLVSNLSNEKVMLETWIRNESTSRGNYSMKWVLDTFGMQGLDMLVVDAIIGNSKRTWGNIGYLKNADNGRCADVTSKEKNKGKFGMVPLYNFGNALSTEEVDDELIRETVDSLKNDNVFVKRAKELLRKTILQGYVNLFIERAASMHDRLNNL